MQVQTESGPIAEAAAIPGDSFPLQSPAHRRRARRVLAFAAIGAAAYLAALAATVPARLVAPAAEGVVVSGTIWSGAATLAGGDRIGWSWAPLRSLAQLGFAIDWRATGPATDLAGNALFKPGRVILESVEGRAGGSLLGVIAPALPFACDMRMTVDLPRIALGGEAQGFSGEVRSDSGVCRPTEAGGLATPVPAMRMTAEQADDGSTLASIAPLGQRRNRLVKITLGKDGRLAVGVTPEGARALPFLSPTGGMTIETDL